VRLKKCGYSTRVSQNVYELSVAKDPDMARVGPLEPWDLHYLREIDDSGFIDTLYAS
jgi:hypothetical protein